MQKVSLTEITDRLQEPDGAHVQSEIRKQLLNLYEKVEMRLKNGTNPYEFEEFEKIKQAVISAISILNNYIK